MSRNGTTLSQDQLGVIKENRDIWQQMADLVARVELNAINLSKGNSDKPDFSHRLQEARQQIDQQLGKIQGEIHHFRLIMSRAGVKDWYQEAEKLASAGKKELHIIENSCNQLKKSVAEQCENLNSVSLNTIKAMAQLAGALRNVDIKALSEAKAQEMHQVCAVKLQKVNRVVRFFHWRNLALVVLITLLTTVITNLYINAEWPWETHKNVIKQREAGKILINSWQRLSFQDQELMLEEGAFRQHV